MTRGEAGTLMANLQRDLRIAALARMGLGALLIIGFLVAVAWPDSDAREMLLFGTTLTAVFGWVVLSAASLRQVRATTQAALFLASGRLELAERQLVQAMTSFSIYNMPKLLACHNLAVVAHGRGEYAAAAELCSGVLQQTFRLRRSARRMTQMLLADCQLFMADVAAAGQALEGLDVFDDDMRLAERQMLLPIETRYLIAAERHADAAQRLPEKLRLAELLDSSRAALVHGLLGKACQEMGREREAAFLTARATLYADLPNVLARFGVKAKSTDAAATVSPASESANGDGSADDTGGRGERLESPAARD